MEQVTRATCCATQGTSYKLQVRRQKDVRRRAAVRVGGVHVAEGGKVLV